MPYSNNGGPWGGGGGGDDDKKGGGRGPWGGGGGGKGPGGQPPVPDIDEIVRKGQEQLKILMGGRAGRGRGPGGPAAAAAASGGAASPSPPWRSSALWLLMSFYTVRPEEQSVELTFGECRGDCIGQPGLNFAPWPIVTHEIVQVTRENTEEIGSGTVRGTSAGLMLTGDENIVDITFQVVWNVRDPAEFLFNLSDPHLDHPGGRRVGDARGGLALAALADPQPRPRHHQPGGQGPDPADPRRVRLGREHRARQLRPRRPAAAGDRRLPRGAGGAPGALDAAEPGRRLRQPDARRGARQRGADACRRPRATAPGWSTPPRARPAASPPCSRNTSRRPR